MKVIDGERGGLMARLVWSLVLVGVVAICLFLVLAVRKARETVIASNAKSPLNQLQLAFRNYHEAHGCFPPAYVADKAGKPIHSWRALILPYIDEAELYRLYDFAEPWDGPNNSNLAGRMPRMFHCPSEPDSNAYANYVVIVGPETAFPGPTSTSLAEFEDGADNTILLAEISNSRIPWLEPRDLDADTMSFSINDASNPSISTSRWNGPYVVFADYIQTHTLTRRLHPTVLKALTTMRGHEAMFMVDVALGEFDGLVSPKLGPAADADLANFKDWPNVRDLWLNRSPVTDAGIVQLSRAPDLSRVHLAQTQITDDGLKCFEGRTQLYELDLSGTGISDAGLAHLSGLVEMHHLDLSNTRVTDAGLDHLYGLKETVATFVGFSCCAGAGISLCARAMQGFNGFGARRGMFLANHVEGDPSMKLIFVPDPVNRVLHFAMATITALDCVRCRGQ